MKAPRFAKLLAQLLLLNQPQRLQVLEALHPAAGLVRVTALIDQIRAPDRRCPNAIATICTGMARPTTSNVSVAASAAALSTT